ncbi:AsnC family transcriptional regulator, partial [archaeon]|nr:AsnC family transcriptional regulator [archaeon]
MKLDLKGKKILYELYQDCRVPSNHIAKNVGLSREAVDYRIKVLEKEGGIHKYITLVDTPRLGYLTYNVYINLQNCSEKDEKEIINYVVNHSFTKWVVTCSGQWDLAISVAARDTQHLNEILYEFTAKFKNKIKFYDILSTLGVYKDADIALVIRDNITIPKKGFTATPPKELPKLDETDMKILSLLSMNARENIVNIAQKVNLTPEGTSYRIKKMVKDKIIRGFRAVLDVTKLGHL